MNNTNQRGSEIQELKRANSLTSAPKDETTDGTSIYIKDPDTMLSMTVLLIACLALAVLAHVLV